MIRNKTIISISPLCFNTALEILNNLIRPERKNKGVNIGNEKPVYVHENHNLLCSKPEKIEQQPDKSKLKKTVKNMKVNYFLIWH